MEKRLHCIFVLWTCVPARPYLLSSDQNRFGDRSDDKLDVTQHKQGHETKGTRNRCEVRGEGPAWAQ